ncbi:hypothetical protein ANCCAN_05928 [Ancylostoma caninum]|uniref:Uncharacterized protein n=1 Tax=Ancylostoma caninum TaxID=29170 RepID=A0A368GXC1_ANCCA|nr:hypothetical protein ANCCAN_05928 [Ancylostoma caninum]
MFFSTKKRLDACEFYETIKAKLNDIQHFFTGNTDGLRDQQLQLQQLQQFDEISISFGHHSAYCELSEQIAGNEGSELSTEEKSAKNG